MSTQSHHQLVVHEKMDADAVGNSESIEVVAKQISSTYERNTKRRVWETSSSSLHSKRVKAAHVSDQSCSDSVLVLDKEDKENFSSDGIRLGLEENISSQKSKTVDAILSGDESGARAKNFNIMLMDIADGPKKAYLTKVRIVLCEWHI